MSSVECFRANCKKYKCNVALVTRISAPFFSTRPPGYNDSQRVRLARAINGQCRDTEDMESLEATVATIVGFSISFVTIMATSQ